MAKVYLLDTPTSTKQYHDITPGSETVGSLLGRVYPTRNLANFSFRIVRFTDGADEGTKMDATTSTVLHDGDRVSVAPRKVEGACLSV